MTRICTCTRGLVSTLELSRKRKQAAKASCSSCGRPLVDVGPLAESMVSTVGVELTNVINPDLTWKTVTKGYRSVPRRGKRTASRSLNADVQLDNRSPRKVEDLSVSESEKLGVIVLGQRFANEVEHVPIKKRRHLFLSPAPTPLPHHEESLSPKPQSPSHPEEPKRVINSEWCCLDSIPNQQMGAFQGSIVVQFDQGVDDGDMNIKLEDFSGIALLAAAACNNSVGNDVVEEGPIVEEVLSSEGIDSSTSAKPLNETILSVEKDSVQKDNMDGLFGQDNSMVISQTCRNSENAEAVEWSVHSKCDRLHWDLNTLMEAWEQPCDLNVHSQSNTSESISDVLHSKDFENLEGFEIHRNSEDIQDDTESKIHRNSEDIQDDTENKLHRNSEDILDDTESKVQLQLQPTLCKMVSADVHGNHMLLDSRGATHGTCGSDIREHKLEACSGSDRTWSEVKCRSTEHALEPLEYAGAGTKGSTQVSADSFFSIPPCCVTNHASNARAYEETMNTTPICVGVMQNGEDCFRTSAMQLGTTTSLESGQLRNHVVFPDMAVSEKATCRIDAIQSKDGEDHGNVSGLADNRTSSREMLNTVTCRTLDVEYSVSKSGELGPSRPSPKCENVSPSIAASQPTVTIDVKGEGDKASAADAVLIDSPLQVEPKELVPAFYGHSDPNSGMQGKFISHELCETYGNSPASHSGRIELEDPSENFVDLDVSHDDWDHVDGVENIADLQSGYDSPFEDGELRESVLFSWDGNNVEGETECVDYGSDDREADDFDALDYSLSERVELEQSGKADDMKEPSHSASSKTKFSGWDLLPEGRESSTDRTTEINDVGTRKIHTSNRTDGHDLKGFSVGKVGSRVSKQKLSGGEGSSCSDVLHRKGAVFVEWSRSNNLDDSYFRAEGEFGSEKSLGWGRPRLEMHGRSQEDGYWVDSSVGYSDSRNHYSTGYHGPHGPRRPRPRRVTTNMAAKVEGSNCCDNREPINYSRKGVHHPPIRRRLPIDKDDAYGMHRERVPMKDIIGLRSRGWSGIYSHGVGRGPREEYHGPAFEDPASSSVRVPHYLARREQGLSSQSHRKSRSRSRTHSPIAWNLQRERNAGTRYQVGPSDFRSGARMNRMRLPFQNSSFRADSENDFLPLPRGRFSPQRNSRWIGDQNCVADHFRDGISPVRMSWRRQRFDTMGSLGRLKSEDYFRPMTRPGRFTEMDGSTGRRKYDSSDDDRKKHGYEMVHRVRRFEDDRLRTDRRDERSPFRYNNDRMYITAPRSSKIRDYDEGA